MPKISTKSTKLKPLKRKAKSTRPRGRPSLYRPEYAEIARLSCLLGATNAELASKFNVSDEAIISRWLAKYPDFRQAVKAGRDGADNDVASALYMKAMSGDTTACIFWLKNRRPALWRDKREVHETRDETKRVTVELSERAKQHIQELKQLLFRDEPAGEANGCPPGEGNGAANGRSGNGSMH